MLRSLNTCSDEKKIESLISFCSLCFAHFKEIWIFTTTAEICLILFLFYLRYVKFSHTFGEPKKKKCLAPGVFESELLPYIFY